MNNRVPINCDHRASSRRIIAIAVVMVAGLSDGAAQSHSSLRCDGPDARERECRAALDGRAVRFKETLILNTAKGRVTLQDRPADDPQGQLNYVLTGYDRGFYILRVIEFGEVRRGMLIDERSGAQHFFVSEPVFSPSGQRFFVTANFAFGSPDEPYLEIFQIARGAIRRVYQRVDHAIPGLVWDQIAWLDNDNIIFSTVARPSHPARKMVVQRQGPHWTLKGPN